MNKRLWAKNRDINISQIIKINYEYTKTIKVKKSKE